jgi:CheY-like chemotaxis protein
MAEALELPGLGHFVPEKYSVLLFDDEEETTAEIAQQLRRTNSKVVDEAHDRGEATRLVRERRYDAVVTDVLVEPGKPRGDGERQGDVWLLEHARETEGAFKIVFTAHEDLIKDKNFDALKRIGAKIITKGVDATDQLIDAIEEKRREKVAKVFEKVRRFGPFELQRESAQVVFTPPVGIEPLRGSPPTDWVGQPVPPEVLPPAPQLVREVTDMFVKWLRAQDDLGMTLGKRSFTAGQLSKELESGSVVGQKLLRMFLRHIRYCLGWEDVPTYEQKLEQRRRP